MNENQFPGGQGYPNPQQGQPQQQWNPQQGQPQQQWNPQQGQPQQQWNPQQGQPQQQWNPQQGQPQQQWNPQQGQPQQQWNPQQGQPQQQWNPQQGQPQQQWNSQQGQPQPGYWAQNQGGNPRQGTPQPGYWSQPQNKTSNSHVGVIIGIVVGVIVLFLMVCFVTGFVSGFNKAKDEKFSDAKFKRQNWIEEYSNSYLVPESGNSFKYYKDKNDLSNYYYTGHYELYTGTDAIVYVVDELSEYSVTREEINGIIDRNPKYKKDNFVCLVLKNEERIIDGENTAEKTVVTPYYGFYLKDSDGEGYLDIANMNTGTYYLFRPE